MGLLANDQILALHQAALSARLDRTALLAGIAPFDQSIPTVPSPAAQLVVDLYFLNDAGSLADGSVPLRIWLKTAAQLSVARSEHRIFEAAHRSLMVARLSPDPRPSYHNMEVRRMAEELERARFQKRALEAAGAPVEAVDRRILEIRRKLREGGQLREGDALGRFTLLELIGRGGFGIVWKAFDQEQKTVVAVKVLHTNLAGDTIRRERFFRGARMMASLEHPAIVKVFAPSEEDEGFHFFVMEHVDGEDLQQAVLRGSVSQQRALLIVLAIGEALALAHGRGLIHRDVKPANILLGASDETKLTDFDLVGAENSTGGTPTGAMGTFLYAAPESMVMAADADARADVFSLAMTAVFALHGRPLPPTALRHTDAFVDSLNCGAAIKETLKRALDWERDKRFDDARAFCDALAGAMSERFRWIEPVMMRETPADGPSKPRLEEGNDSFGRLLSFAVDGVVQRMRWIPPGSFRMGSPESEVGRFENEGPPHTVMMTEGYWLGETPCTQALWEAVMGDNPSRFKSPQRPVECVTWDDCQVFLRKLAELMPNLGARLPTEAEWEYACRARTHAATWAGDLVVRHKYDAPLLDAIAWYGGNSGFGFDLKDGEDSSKWPGKQYPHSRAGTRPVGMKEANPFGLYDMLGNVWEWCEDWYGPYKAETVADPRGAETGSYRVFHGGSWKGIAANIRAANRSWNPPGLRDVDLGFRLARSLAPSKGAEPHLLSPTEKQ